MEKKKSCIYRDSNYRSYSPYPRRCLNFEYCPSFQINKSTRFVDGYASIFRWKGKSEEPTQVGPLERV